MTTQEEAEYLNRLLPEIAEHPGGFNIRLFAMHPVGRERLQELKGLARRLATEGLAIPSSPDSTYSLVVTPKGKQVVEGEHGYLGHLERQARQERLEERRAARSANGSWISGLAAAVGIALSIYSLYSGSQDTGELKAQVAAQAKRIQALEIQLKQRKY